MRGPSGSLSTYHPPAYPLRVHPTERYLVDSLGVPFTMSSQSFAFMNSAALSDVSAILATWQAQGFNTLFFEAIYPDAVAAGGVQGDRSGNLAFTKQQNGSTYTDQSQLADFSSYNPAWFANLDQTIALATSYGFLLWTWVAYYGFNGDASGFDGYGQSINADTTAHLQAYGSFLANRYKSQSNMIYVLGGDRNPNSLTNSITIQQQINSVDPSKLWMLDCADGSLPRTVWSPGTTGAIVNLDEVYNDQKVTTAYLQTNLNTQYNTSPTLPICFKEGCYDGDHSASNQFLRSQTYVALLNGSCGYSFGVSEVADAVLQGTYATAIQRQGSLDCARANAWIRAHRWELLVPDFSNTFLTNGASYTGATYNAAARASDGSWGAIYVPTSQSLTVDMSGFAHTVRADWWDPTNARSQPAGAGTYANSGTATFGATPGSNSASDGDWLLVFS